MTNRGVVYVQLDDGAYMPYRAHVTDAGADLCCREDFTLPARGSTVVDTGVHVEIPDDMAGLLVSKSGLNVNFGVTTTGLIDAGYTGSIRVKMYNNSDNDICFKSGMKVSQLVIIPVYYAEFFQVDKINGGERGNNGFGSTGK